MKKLSFIAIACLGLFFFQSCQDSSTDSIDSAKESNEMKQDSAEKTSGAEAVPVSEADSKFAVEAAGAGMTEVQLGELAQQKSSNKKVKAFGEMMVKDHTAAGDELKAIASSNNITLPPSPGEDQLDHIKKLSAKSGKDFDKDYIDMMVKDHKMVVDAFEKASKDAKNTQLQAFATKTLPIVQSHLDSAKAIQDSWK